MEFRDLKKQYMVLKKEIDNAVLDVMASARYIMGEPVAKLEKVLAEYVGVKHCISCANGTDALLMALMAWGIGPEDAVFVPDFSFFASAEVIKLCGAHPVFVDIEEDTFNIDASCLAQAIEQTLIQGKYRPRVVISVDLFGQSANYAALRGVCAAYGLLLLEDAAQGFGGSQSGAMNCSFGDISCTSFFPSKPLGCYGDGGAVFTDDDSVAEILRSIRVHGKGRHKYDNVRIGLNSRLDTVQAAILLVKLEAFRSRELEAVGDVAKQYTSLLEDIVETPAVRSGNVSSWAQYTILLPSKAQRDALQKHLQENGIPAMVFYSKPLHLQVAFEGAKANCPITEDVCRRVLSLPMHPYLTDDKISAVCAVIRNFLT